MPPPDPLEQLRVLDISSADFPNQIVRFLRSDEYQRCTPGLEGDNLVWLVEFLDNVMNKLDPTHTAFSICFVELRGICSTRSVLPKLSTISDALLSTDVPFASGGSTDIYEGSLNGFKVCVEKVRMYSDGDPQKVKIFYLAAVTWHHLKHSNIVPFVGAIHNPLQLVSVWMSGGGLTEYINEHPEKCRFALLHDIAEGLNYLHSCSVIHGDIKGSNVLVDGFGQARITDFSHSTVTGIPDSASDTSEVYDHVTRWTAPEILENRGRFTKESDVFSFAMVMVEIFTGVVPFSNCALVTSVTHIIKGKRPPRPADPVLTDDLWALMQGCWNQEPILRPQMSEVLKKVPGSISKRFRGFSKSSPEFRLALERFFDSTEYKDCITYLQDAALEEFVDFLDDVLHIQGLPRELFVRTLHNLREISKLTVNPHAVGEHAEIWRGKMSLKNHNRTRINVCLKAIKIGKVHQELYREVALWVNLNHPNILPCFGITLRPLRIVTEWIPNGHVMEYLQEHRDADRIRLLIDVAQGLEYLHSYGVIHRNLKPVSPYLDSIICRALLTEFVKQNILVNTVGCACLSDVGFATTARNRELESSSNRADTHASRRLAPEIIKNGESSRQSDMFSYGFVAAEVFLGEFLWRAIDVTEAEAKPGIVNLKRPGKPEGQEKLGLTPGLWWTLTKCWETDPEDRITVSEMLNFLSYMTHPLSSSSPALRKAEEQARDSPSQELIDELDQGRFQILDNNVVSDNEWPKFLNLLCKMCSRREVPTSMLITGFDNQKPRPTHTGGNADVFEGVHNGRRVAIKVVRVCTNDLDEYARRFRREAVAWKHLKHPNILPLLGANVRSERFSMASEWMDHGNINEFTEKHRKANRAQLLVDVAHGLEYLHGLDMVHGDLKGANILIRKDYRACLADFGLSTIVRVAPRTSTGGPFPPLTSENSIESGISLMSYTSGGTRRWMSPETLWPEMFGLKTSRPSKQSDCYSLAMTVYEVLYGKVPYWELPEIPAVARILEGVRPKKPPEATNFGFTDGLWKIVERCWSEDRDARPDVKAILSQLNYAAWTWGRGQPM